VSQADQLLRNNRAYAAGFATGHLSHRPVEADTGLRPHFALEAFPDLEADVRQSIARIEASPFVPHRDQVRGFVYDVGNGELREVAR
jgi:carbonic anhydrase